MDHPEARGTALLVEDEPFVAMVARQILEDEGFSVSVASTATNALSVLSEEAGNMVLAVVDLGLPDMPGDKLVEQILSRWTDLPIMIASGYGIDELAERFPAGHRLALVPKPYDMAALRRGLKALGFSVEQ